MELPKATSKNVRDLRPIPLDEVNRVLIESMPPVKAKENPRGFVPLDEASDAFMQIKDKEVTPEPPKKPGTFQTLLTDLHNQQSAGSQRTTPILAAHAKNFISDELYENDAGHIQFKDPETGKIVTTDNKKHVVLRDPADNKLKAYARTEDTNTNRLVALGHVVNPGLVTGSPPIARAGMTAIKSGKLAGEEVPKAAYETLQAAERAGIDVPRIALSENRAANAMANVAAHLPGGREPFEHAAKGLSQGLEKAHGAASELPTGTITNPELAGSTARTALTEYAKPKGTLAGRVSDAYDAVDAIIPATAKSTLPNTTRAAQKIQTEFEAMGKTGLDETVKEVIGAVTQPGGITYEGLKHQRSLIGEMVDTGITPQGISNSDLKRLYGALTTDMKELVGTNPRALQLWERANNYAKLAADRRVKLAKVLGQDTKSDEAIFHSILRTAGSTASADAKLLDTARKAMGPEAWKDISAGVVSRMGWRASSEGAKFDPGAFLRDFASLSPRGKDALFGSQSQPLRKALEELDQISHTWPEVARFAKPGGELAQNLALGGVLHKPLEYMGIIMGSRILSSAFTKPATAKSLVKWAQRYKDLTLQPNNKAHRRALMTATEQFAQAMGRDPQVAEEVNSEIASGANKALTGVAIAQHLARKIWSGLEPRRGGE